MRASKGLRASVLVIFLMSVSAVAFCQQAASDSAVKPDAATLVSPVDAKVPPSPPPAPADDVTGIPIGRGDLVELSIFGVNDMTKTLRVNNGGDVSIPLLGLVHVEGLTPEHAQALVAKRLQEEGLMRDPQVSIFVKEYAGQGISVVGEVTKPGVYPPVGNRRLFELITLAGGLTQRAGRQIVITHRDAPTEPVKITLKGDISKSTEQNIQLEPGDIVLVPKAGIVYVVGEVSRPGGYVMDSDHLTVMQAVALAGGVNRQTAKVSATTLVRKSPDGMQQIPVPLKNILQAKADDIPLQADDILFVPVSGTTIAGHRLAEAAVQFATAAGIFGVYRY